MLDVVAQTTEEEDEELPAWSLPRDAADRITIDNPLP
jgi:hypothetical protein